MCISARDRSAVQRSEICARIDIVAHLLFGIERIFLRIVMGFAYGFAGFAIGATEMKMGDPTRVCVCPLARRVSE